MSPKEPSSDRLWFWFAVSSVAFLIVLAISPVKDYFRGYRRYQTQYRSLLTRSAGSLKELKQARAQHIGIHQIWLPGFDGRVDRCVTCHLGLEDPRMAKVTEPFRQHPRTPHTPGDIPRFGCVICHQGQGRATTVAEAHGSVPDWSSPLLPLRYTEAACGRCHRGDEVPEASLLSEGRALMTRVGCYGCHKVAGQEGWKTEAPDLAGLAQKTNPAWLKAWLHAPRSLRPATWMPNFALSDGEIDSLTAFLWTRPPIVELGAETAGGTASREVDHGAHAEHAQVASQGEDADQSRTASQGGDVDHGKVLFSASRCISCHTVEGRGNGSAPELSGIASEVNRRWLVAFLGDPQRFYPGIRMPRYHFSPHDLADLSAYMMEELTDPSIPEPSVATPSPGVRPAEKAIEAGKEIYKRLGCGSCHRINGEGIAVPIGPELTGIADKPAAQLDFGMREDLPRRLPDWLAAKVSDPRSFRQGLRMPQFNLTEHQVEALVTALLSLGRDPLPAAYVMEAPQHDYTPPGHFGQLAGEYRCLSCHQINGAGGDISTAPLGAEGSKVKEAWLASYLKLPTTLRPILEERMIPLQIPDDQAAFMANFVENVLRDDRIPEEIFPAGAAYEQIERGRKLFYERYGCQACHMVGGRGGYYGPLLDGAAARLKTGWIYWWLKGPQRWRADVREPDYGLDDTDARDLTAYVASIPPPEGSGLGRDAGSAGSAGNSGKAATGTKRGKGRKP